jgi:O-antigen/teichoic acid export membrane protein
MSAGEVRGAARMARIFVALLSADMVTRAMAGIAAVIVVRALAPAAFGEVAFALAAAVLLGLLVDLGLSVLLIRDVSEDPADAPELLGSALKLEATLGVVVFGGGAIVALTGVLPGPASGDTLSLAFGVAAVNSLTRPFQATLAGYGRAHLVTVAYSLRGTALVAATGLVALSEPSPAAFVAAALAAEVLGLGVISGLYRSRGFLLRLDVPWSAVAALLRRAIPFALLIVFGVLYLQIDLVMLGLLGSDPAVGNYALAVRVLEVASAVPVFFGSAFLATVAQTGAGTERAAAQTASALRYLLLLCLPLAFSLAMVADPLIELVAGERYADAGEILVRLSPVLALTAVYAVLVNLQVALDRTALVAKISLAGLLLKIGLNAWAIPRYGANGAALAAVAGEGLVVGAQVYFTRNDLDVRRLLAWCGRLGTAAILMVAAGLVALDGIGWPAALAIGLMVFALAALTTRCLSVGELRVALASASARSS